MVQFSKVHVPVKRGRHATTERLASAAVHEWSSGTVQSTSCNDVPKEKTAHRHSEVQAFVGNNRQSIGWSAVEQKHLVAG